MTRGPRHAPECQRCPSSVGPACEIPHRSPALSDGLVILILRGLALPQPAPVPHGTHRVMWAHVWLTCARACPCLCSWL